MLWNVRSVQGLAVVAGRTCQPTSSSQELKVSQQAVSRDKHASHGVSARTGQEAESRQVQGTPVRPDSLWAGSSLQGSLPFLDAVKCLDSR